jgi:cell division protein FtsN
LPANMRGEISTNTTTQNPPTVVATANTITSKIQKPTSPLTIEERPLKEKVETPVVVSTGEKERPTEPSEPTIVNTKSVDEGKFYVIVGTYSSEENAQLELKKIPNRQISIFKDGQYYRLSAGNFMDKKEANNMAKTLNTEGVACFVIRR